MSPTRTRPPTDMQPSRSLEEVHRSVAVPGGPWWRRMLAFAGPAYMVSVGYMDPGNWATDIAGGAQFGYRLIWVLLMSNLMAVLLQTLSARLGLVTGRDLAQACRDSYPGAVRWGLFGLCEIAIAACDLAEVLGTAIGLNLLTGIPLVWAVTITAADVMLLLAIQRLGMRKMEAFIISLVLMIGLCFIIEIFLARPSVSGVLSGFQPRVLTGAELYIAIGILGATVMPHNLYLHSALVQSRDVPRTLAGVRQACRFNLVDSAVALNAAFLVNTAILVLAAAAFWPHHKDVAGVQEAHHLLDGLLGSRIAPIAFAVALICAGQSSTVTGTLAGQVTMEGFLRFHMRPWLRRMITRLVAITPAVLVIGLTGDRGAEDLLVLSQVILSLQLPFAVVPLIRFTSSKAKMGPFASRPWAVVLAWAAAAIIIALNVMLLYQQIAEWIGAAGPYRWAVAAATVPLAVGLGLLLAWLALAPERAARPVPMASADQIATAALAQAQRFGRVGVALEAKDTDAAMLAEAIALARSHQADLVLVHVVEGLGGQWYGGRTDDEESRHDERYLADLAARLRRELAGSAVRDVRHALGYGSVPAELQRVAQEEKLDILVVGTHGHRLLADLWRGATIGNVRHKLPIPILAVRQPRGQ